MRQKATLGHGHEREREHEHACEREGNVNVNKKINMNMKMYNKHESIIGDHKGHRGRSQNHSALKVQIMTKLYC